MSCDVEYPKFFTTAIRTARKTHTCTECGRSIASGDKYRYSSGKWDDFIGSYKTCLDCDEIKVWLDKKIDCCIAFGEMYTELIESEIISRGRNASRYVVSYSDEIEMISGFVRLKKCTSETSTYTKEAASII